MCLTGALALTAFPPSASASPPIAHAAATCEEYANQAAAQRAADTRDPDGDGLYCESLPCPCAGPGSSGGSGGSDRAAARRRTEARAKARARARARARVKRRARAKARARWVRRRARLREARQRRAIERGDTVVVEVADGDTLRVRKADGRILRVRLIGIDTPETRDPGTPVQCGGPEATSNMLALTFPSPADTNGDGLSTKREAAVGASVRLKTDRTQDVYDRYKRALAYVNVLAGGQPNRPPGYDIGRDQILAGWATTYVFDEDFARLNSYGDAETVANEGSLGVHGKCGGNFHTPT